MLSGGRFMLSGAGFQDPAVRAHVSDLGAGPVEAVQAARGIQRGRLQGRGLPRARHGQLPLAAGLERRH
eukprot:225673-Prorocentrum_minimum.AAC.1